MAGAFGRQRTRIGDFRHFRCGLREVGKRSDKFGHSNCVFLRESGKAVESLLPL